MIDWLTHFKARQGQMLADTSDMVVLESFTADKPMVDALGSHLVERYRQAGAASVERIPRTTVGDILLAKWGLDRPGKPILILAHMDTVHPSGTLLEFPLRHEDGKLYGPGTIDMKASIAVALAAIEGIEAQQGAFAAPVWLLTTSDEETGSEQSRELIEELAQQAALVLVMEPGLPNGDLKAWRKGGAKITVTVRGQAAHAGMAPEKGINAIVEMGRQILALNEMNSLKYGTSVAVTQISGGTAPNVVPAEATIMVDFRASDEASFKAAHAKINGLMPQMPGAEVIVETAYIRPPMEYTAVGQAAFKQAQALAKRMGMDIQAGGTGGMSDANFTARLGVPTLDGLGPLGGGAHTLEEYVTIDSLHRRAALMAAILTDWQA